MEAYCNVVQALEDKFYGIELNHVPRRYNEEADELTKITSSESPFPQMFFAGCRQAIRQPRPEPLKPEGTLGGSLESNRRGAYGRGPLERGICTLPARGVWR
jgi:hypothetical protein